MARMIPLSPPPKADIGQGPFSLVGTEAGRFAKGLTFTCQVWNGTLQGRPQQLSAKEIDALHPDDGQTT